MLHVNIFFLYTHPWFTCITFITYIMIQPTWHCTTYVQCSIYNMYRRHNTWGCAQYVQHITIHYSTYCTHIAYFAYTTFITCNTYIQKTLNTLLLSIDYKQHIRDMNCTTLHTLQMYITLHCIALHGILILFLRYNIIMDFLRINVKQRETVIAIDAISAPVSVCGCRRRLNSWVRFMSFVGAWWPTGSGLRLFWPGFSPSVGTTVNVVCRYFQPMVCFIECFWEHKMCNCNLQTYLLRNPLAHIGH